MVRARRRCGDGQGGCQGHRRPESADCPSGNDDCRHGRIDHSDPCLAFCGRRPRPVARRLDHRSRSDRHDGRPPARADLASQAADRGWKTARARTAGAVRALDRGGGYEVRTRERWPQHAVGVSVRASEGSRRRPELRRSGPSAGLRTVLDGLNAPEPQPCCRRAGPVQTLLTTMLSGSSFSRSSTSEVKTVTCPFWRMATTASIASMAYL